jgi:hypothetical protein
MLFSLAATSRKSPFPPFRKGGLGGFVSNAKVRSHLK